MQENKKAKLSKAILDMKFMKRTKERVLKEEEDREGHDMYADDITEAMRASGNIIFVESSLSYCKDLVEGRLSFGGVNADVEKSMKGVYAVKLEEAERKKEQEVTDIDMARGYSTLVDTIGKKFESTNKKNRTAVNKKRANNGRYNKKVDKLGIK